jgi:serine/threonine-protein kinase
MSYLQHDTSHDDHPPLMRSLGDLIGQDLNNSYRLERVLGQGAMGMVFVATQRSVGRSVAVKLLKDEQLQNGIGHERFQREMTTIAGLNHPNIVSLLDSGYDARHGLFFLVMELIDGISLGNLIYSPPRAARVELALEIVYQICGALAESHDRGIIHRDLKPDNVLLVPMADETLQIKVVDFGIARSADSSADKRLTKPGIIGTPAYMAPELCRSAPIDGRTDLYSVGVILFELLTATIPFEGKTSMAIIVQLLQEPAPLLTDILTDAFPYPELVTLTRQLLEKERESRPASAIAVRDAIDQVRARYKLQRPRLERSVSHRSTFEPWLMPQGSQPIHQRSGSLIDSGDERTDTLAQSLATTQEEHDDELLIGVPLTPAHEGSRPTHRRPLPAPAPPLELDLPAPRSVKPAPELAPLPADSATRPQREDHRTLIIVASLIGLLVAALSIKLLIDVRSVKHLKQIPRADEQVAQPEAPQAPPAASSTPYPDEEPDAEAPPKKPRQPKKPRHKPTVIEINPSHEPEKYNPVMKEKLIEGFKD